MADTQPIALDAHFSQADREAWQVAARKALRGKPLEGLTQRTLEGIVRKPLYDTPAHEDAAKQRFLPVLRDARALDRRMVGWDIRVHIAGGNAAQAGQRAAEEVAGAARSVWLTPGTAERPGVALPDTAAVTALLGHVDLDTTPIAIDADAHALPWLQAMLEAARANGHATGDLTGAIRTDVAGTLAQTGTLPSSVDACFDDLADAHRLGETEAPWVHLVAASSLPIHDAGGDAALSLGFAIASGLTSVRALVARGVSIESVVARTELTVGTHADQFLTIASLRAMRLLWAKVLKAHGVSDAQMFVHAVTGRTTTAVKAPWTNMLRGANEAAAAAMGSADAITLTPYDSAIGEPDALAQRIARNAQLILVREGHLARVADPAAGSVYVEELTDRLAREAWRHLQRIEAAGGVISALTSGLIQRAVAEGVGHRRAALSEGERVLVGVSKYQQVDEPTLTRPNAEKQPKTLGVHGRADDAPSCTPLPSYTDETIWLGTQAPATATDGEARP